MADVATTLRRSWRRRRAPAPAPAAAAAAAGQKLQHAGHAAATMHGRRWTAASSRRRRALTITRAEDASHSLLMSSGKQQDWDATRLVRRHETRRRARRRRRGDVDDVCGLLTHDRLWVAGTGTHAIGDDARLLSVGRAAARLEDSFPGGDVGEDIGGGGVVLPTQADVMVGEGGTGAEVETIEEYKPLSDIEYLQELLAIQDNGPKAVGIFGTRNCGILHQQLIEVLSYAIGITGNHIFTSGATGTNAAVIRGALRANEPDLLTVVLPQSLSKQPPESQEELAKVKHVIEMPQNDELPLIEASRLCNREIIGQVRQVICFLFHDSTLMMETCLEAKQLRKMVTTFFLD